MQQGCALLTHIHKLYTVYHQIVVYDRSGSIVATSLRSEITAPALAPTPIQPPGGAHHALIGQRIEADTLAQVLALPHSLAYHVTPWRPNSLNAGHDPADPGLMREPTYAYHAAIRGEDGQLLGGIGLVFHAARELRAMLDSAVPSQAVGSLQTQVLYLSRQGMVMASTDPQQPPGSQLSLPPELLQLSAGESRAQAMVHGDQYCIVAATAGSGYREFKRSDGYREEVLAVSIQAFGHEQEDAVAAVRRRRMHIQSLAPSQQAHEMATFFVGAHLMALDAACVLEALPAAAIAPVSAERMPHCVGTLARYSQGAVIGYVWVFDLGALLHGQPTTVTAQSQVIVLQHAGCKLGLLVSDLQGVARFGKAQIIPTPAMAPTQQRLLQALIRANEGSLLIQCLSPAGLLQMLQGRVQTAQLAPAT